MPKRIERGKCAVFDLLTLQEATNNFHEKNKLGEGGFGTVYKVRNHNMQERRKHLQPFLFAACRKVGCV